MKNKKTNTAPRMEWWKNKKNKLNYRLVSANGENVSGAHNQGYERWAGIEKNLKAIYGLAGVSVILTKKELHLGDNYFPVIEVKAP